MDMGGEAERGTAGWGRLAAEKERRRARPLTGVVLPFQVKIHSRTWPWPVSYISQKWERRGGGGEGIDHI